MRTIDVENERWVTLVREKALATNSRMDPADIDTEQLVRENISWMLALAERLMGERSAAEDVVQDAFMVAFRGLAKFEGRSTLRTWLHRITVNTSLDHLRRIKRRAEQTIDPLLPEFDRHECRVEAPWSSLLPLSAVLENEELRMQVNTAVATLPESYRTVFLLRDVEGYDTDEVATLVGISQANVKVRLHRARAALKKLLEPILTGELGS